ncbi:MAG TPA: SDR family NAD(P)-dependent oxidoreductase [Erythrobacter sp.]|nr:SDR family NAD(P)-dependent oxidoreductase [Erythrobacter sp.]
MATGGFLLTKERRLQPLEHARVLITGASGNLGRELVLRLARPGMRLALWGRDRARLDEVAALACGKGAAANIRSIELADFSSALKALAEDDDDGPFDLALLVAGQGDTLPPGSLVEDPAQVIRLIQANYTAPAAMASALAARMAARGRGRIGLVGTAAASHSLPFAASYSGSKAGLARHTDALRLAVAGRGVSITLITPGFFAGMDGAAAHSRPGQIAAGIVAERAIAATMAGRAEVVIPRRFVLLRWFDRLLPRFLRDRILLSLRLP